MMCLEQTLILSIYIHFWDLEFLTLRFCTSLTCLKQDAMYALIYDVLPRLNYTVLHPWFGNFAHSFGRNQEIPWFMPIKLIFVKLLVLNHYMRYCLYDLNVLKHRKSRPENMKRGFFNLILLRTVSPI